MQVNEKRYATLYKQQLAQFLASDVVAFNLLLPKLFLPANQEKLVAEVIIELFSDKRLAPSQLRQGINYLQQLAAVSLEQQRQLQQAIQAARAANSQVTLQEDLDSNAITPRNLDPDSFDPRSSYQASNVKLGIYDENNEVDYAKLEADNFADFAETDSDFNLVSYPLSGISQSSIAEQQNELEQKKNLQGKEWDEQEEEQSLQSKKWNLQNEEWDEQGFSGDFFKDLEQENLPPSPIVTTARPATSANGAAKGSASKNDSFTADNPHSFSLQLLEQKQKQWQQQQAANAAAGYILVSNVHSFLTGLSKKMNENLRQQSQDDFNSALPYHEQLTYFHLNQSYPAAYWRAANETALKEINGEIFATTFFSRAQDDIIIPYLEQAELDLDALDEGKSLSYLYPVINYLETSRLKYNYTLALANQKQHLRVDLADTMSYKNTTKNDTDTIGNETTISRTDLSAISPKLTRASDNLNTTYTTKKKGEESTEQNSDRFSNSDSFIPEDSAIPTESVPRSQWSYDYTKFGYVNEQEVEATPWYNLSYLLYCNNIMNKMHCFDISHSAGMFTKGSCVATDQQGAISSDYRHFNIEGITPGDDYAAMLQAVDKRYHSIVDISLMPSIILIDGGANQVKVANQSLIPLVHRLQGIEVYTTLVCQGHNLLNHLASKNYQLFNGLSGNQVTMQALEQVYEQLLLPTLAYGELGVALPSLDMLLRYYFATRAKGTQLKADYLQTYAYLLYQQAQQQQSQIHQYEQDLLTSFSDIIIEQNERLAREFTFASKLPADITVAQLRSLILNSYTAIEFLFPIKTVGVTKQENRKLYAEKFLDGSSGEELEIPPQSKELYYLLQLRDAAHNYANRKRQAKQKQSITSARAMLEAIPGLGKTSIDRLYAYFGNTREIMQQLKTSKDPRGLLEGQVGLTARAALALLNHLDSIPA